MTDQLNPTARTPGRKPQINIEVTEEEKVFFGQLAAARRLKIAALVRELLNAEAARLGIPAQLDAFKSEAYGSHRSRYQYVIKADEPTETKLGVFRQFLLKFKADCDFSITSYEPNIYHTGIQCTAYSSSGENSNTIYIGIASDRLLNYKERREIDGVWSEVLGLSLNLEDKWDGTSYVVEKRRTLRGKQMLLKQFVEKYRGAKLDINDAYNGGTAFKVVASTEQEKTSILIEYLPQRAGEAAELRTGLDEYQKQASL